MQTSNYLLKCNTLIWTFNF